MCFCFPQLSQSIEKKDKEIEALRKMTVVYDNTPNFGKATDTKDVRGGPDPLALRWNVALTHMHFGLVGGLAGGEHVDARAGHHVPGKGQAGGADHPLDQGGRYAPSRLSVRAHTCMRAYNTELTRPPPPPPPTHHPPQCARLKSQSRS